MSDRRDRSRYDDRGNYDRSQEFDLRGVNGMDGRKSDPRDIDERNRRDFENRRGRDRVSPVRERSREKGRSRDRNSGRGDYESSRAQSRSPKRKARRSRSNSASSDEWLKIKAKRQAKKEGKLWDKPPEGTEGMTAAEIVSTVKPLLLQAATMVASNPQQSRQARRLYLGNIPQGVSEIAVANFINTNLLNTGKCFHSPSISNVQIHAEKAFAFLEFHRAEDATLCMALDGIVWDNQKCKVRRPKDYTPIPGVPSDPKDIVNDLVIPGIVSTNVRDTPFKVYLGNIPTHLTDAQVQTLVSAFGQLRSFHLVTEAGSSLSKGYCFFEYADSQLTAQAVQGLNGLQMGDKHLTCSFANADKLQSMAVAGLLSGLPGAAVLTDPASKLQDTGPPSTILRLGNMVSEAELENDDEYDDILVDVREEMSNHGTVVNVLIPRPSESGLRGPGVGFIFVLFSTKEEAMKACLAMNGRQFAGKAVLASFFDEARFNNGDLA